MSCLESALPVRTDELVGKLRQSPASLQRNRVERDGAQGGDENTEASAACRPLQLGWANISVTPGCVSQTPCCSRSRIRAGAAVSPPAARARHTRCAPRRGGIPGHPTRTFFLSRVMGSEAIRGGGQSQSETVLCSCPPLIAMGGCIALPSDSVAAPGEGVARSAGPEHLA